MQNRLAFHFFDNMPVWKKWGVNVLIWTFLGVLFSLYRLLHALANGIEINIVPNVLLFAIEHYTWAGLTFPLLYSFDRAVGASFGRKIPVILIAASLSHALIYLSLYAGSLHLLKDVYPDSYAHFRENLNTRIITTLFINTLTVLFIFLAWYVWTMVRKHQQQLEQNALLKGEVAEVRLQMLRMQMNPHFIFNSFNTVSMLIRLNENKKATDILARLADLLRTTLYGNNNHFVTLDEELAFCKKYLEIELERFNDQLTVNYTIGPECGGLQVPNMILQPLLENSFKHGLFEKIGSSPCINIEAHCTTEMLYLSVSNTGMLKAANGKHNGIGIKNLQERLAIAYGNGSGLTLSQEGDMVSAKIKIPIK